MASKLYDWLDGRLKLKAVERTLLDEPIPGGASWIYVFGSATLFLFLLLESMPPQAHEEVRATA